jgi:hypothetical protein
MDPYIGHKERIIKAEAYFLGTVVPWRITD